MTFLKNLSKLKIVLHFAKDLQLDHNTLISKHRRTLEPDPRVTIIRSTTLPPLGCGLKICAEIENKKVVNHNKIQG